MPKVSAIPIILASVALLAGCSESTAPHPTVQSVTVSPVAMVVGKTVQLTATTKDGAGNVLTGRVVTWASNNAAVVTVSGTGLATGVAAGQATITATSEGQRGTTTIAAFVVAAVSAGSLHTCSVALGGAAYCWGDNSFGQLGTGSTDTTAHPTPVAVAGGLTFATVSAGNNHTCGVTTGGAAYCWGDNSFGELGTGTTTNSAAPVAVTGGFTFAAVSVGAAASYTCGVTTGGTAYCWGFNVDGELGIGTTTGSTTPVAVAGGLTFAVVSAGAFHTCGVTTGDAAYCWGDNGAGELGTGTTDSTAKTTPMAVAGGHTFFAVSAGGGYTCGLANGGAAYCWGDNSGGELGTGTTTGSTTPVAVAGGLTFAVVSADAIHTCGVTTGGAAYCWGNNTAGQLGTGMLTGITTPVAVAGGRTFAAVSAGGNTVGHTCGLTTAGIVYCWGRNSAGELGTGTTTDSSVPL